jgi:hypothetical protein
VTLSFRVIPIPRHLADETRDTRLSPGFGHPVQVHVAGASGYGPCRACLRRTREGERRLLLSYDPYPEPDQVSVVGPIYIHEEACAPFEGAGFPEELRGLPMILRGHFRDGSGLVNRALAGEAPEAAIEALFADPRIGFIAIQNPDAACFIARVERA